MKRLGTALLFSMTLMCAANALATSILFVGNSFTYGYGSPVRYFHADSVADLNREGVGGVPALFKAFTVAAGLDYDVYLETHGDVGLDWHVDNNRPVLGSTFGYYLDALVLFGAITGRDPRSLGDGECTGLALDISAAQVAAPAERAVWHDRRICRILVDCEENAHERCTA